ncbi:hypothetical protein AAF712_015631 [Marasmius tenuissimus]|uniref:Uncharacterized protein n=1 Tax=Marasmius tenuissimus TaxID=585030 RepID=A0ABR2Z7Z4_9AGAR
MSHSPSALSNSSEPVLVPNQPSVDQTSDDIPPLENSDGVVAPVNTANNTLNGATHNAPANIGSWGNGELEWGNMTAWDAEITERNWMEQHRWVEGIRVTSLSRREGAWGDEEPRFIWRSSSASGSDSHVTHHTRSDLGKTLSPTGPAKPSPLDDVPIIKSLREAQQNHIPGPTFSFSQVAHCLREVQVDLSSLHSRVSHYDDEIAEIGKLEDKLNEELCELNDKVFAIRSKSTEVDTVVKRLAEVERDLKDLESIALTYSE